MKLGTLKTHQANEVGYNKFKYSKNVLVIFSWSPVAQTLRL
jgi:hypothetical protein